MFHKKSKSISKTINEIDDDNNSNNQKIEFLQRENKQLHEQVKELQNLLVLNKQAMRLLTSQNSTQSDQGSNKGVLMVMKSLQEENSLLQKSLEKLIQERNDAQNQILINQQLTEAAQKHEKELIAELESKIGYLQSKLLQKEEIIVEMERITPTYDEMAGVVIKYRDVLSPEYAIMKFHDEIETLSDQLCKYQKKVEILKSEKQNLQTLNLKLTTELLRVKTSALTHHGKQLFIQQQAPDSDLQNIIKFQQKLMNQINDSDDRESSDASNSPQMSPLPIKNEIIINQPKSIGIPKLDLTRAKQIQEINAKRQIQSLQPQNKLEGDYMILDKLQKLERQLDDVRRNLHREMTLNKTLQFNKDELERIKDELEQRQTILIKSNMNYEAKWRKIFKQYSFLQSFYISNKDQINFQQTQTQTGNNRLIQSPSYVHKISSPMASDFAFHEFDQSFGFMSGLDQKIDENYLKDVELDIKQQEQPQQLPIYNNFYQYFVPVNLNDAQRFLIQFAKDLYIDLQGKFDQMEKFSKQPIKNKNRSLSNIIDYQYSGLASFACQNNYECQQNELSSEKDEDQDNIL